MPGKYPAGMVAYLTNTAESLVRETMKFKDPGDEKQGVTLTRVVEVPSINRRFEVEIVIKEMKVTKREQEEFERENEERAHLRP